MKTKSNQIKIGRFSAKEINLNFIIKVFQNWNGVRINKAVGCTGLVNLIGEEQAEKFVARAFAGKGDVLTCKRYNGVQVSFYLH